MHEANRNPSKRQSATTRSESPPPSVWWRRAVTSLSWQSSASSTWSAWLVVSAISQVRNVP